MRIATAVLLADGMLNTGLAPEHYDHHLMSTSSRVSASLHGVRPPSVLTARIQATQAYPPAHQIALKLQ